MLSPMFLILYPLHYCFNLTLADPRRRWELHLCLLAFGYTLALSVMNLGKAFKGSLHKSQNTEIHKDMNRAPLDRIYATGSLG
jgi:hypothetical protein